MTLPTTARGQARVVPGKGVKINHLFYWASALRDPEVEGMLVPIRYDPYDAGIAYAFVRNRWVQCISEHYGALRGKSERELVMATAELRRRAQQHARQFTVTAKKLADFLASAEGEHVLRWQRAKDREAKDVLTKIGTGQGKPPCDPVVAGRTALETKGTMSRTRKRSVKPLSLDELTVYEEY